MTPLTFPTKKDEAWRYSNLDSLAKIWPLDGRLPHFEVWPGQRLSIPMLEDLPRHKIVVEDHVITVHKDGWLTVNLLNIGGELGRVTLDVTLEEGARFDLNAALLGDGEQTVELVTRVTHAGPNATSNQTVRAIAAGKATTSYLGQVRVARDAQKTDASQSFKAMILDRGASANAKPELEIFADDVKCAHGASIGQLDAQALFYLASRGLDPAAARTLMLQAFIAGLFDDMEDEDSAIGAGRVRFEAAVLAKLEAMT